MAKLLPDASHARLSRTLLALLPPLVSAAIVWLLHPFQPHVWFLFYPAVFISSWIAGRRAGLIATALSLVLAWVFLIPPQYELLKPPAEYLSAAVFCASGVLFGTFHERLRRAMLRSARALRTTEKANARLRRALDERQVFAALIETSSDFIGIADANGKPIYVNPAGRRMVGLSSDHPIETTAIPDYYPPTERAFATDVIVKAMAEHGHWEGETFFRNLETEEAIPVSDTHFVIRDPETGSSLGMGTITRDISDIKLARAELEAVNRDLKRANEEITRLYEKSCELDEARTALFAGVSHELRTPLTLILGTTLKMLDAPETRDAERHDLEVIVRNARTLLRHVNDLLDISKLEAGRMTPEYADTDVARLIRFVAGHFDVLAREKALAFHVEMPEELRAEVDPEKLPRIVFNLLSNAFKFTPTRGQVRLVARISADRLIIEVRDSGPGIPADKREIVFEPFRQLDSGAARRYGGTGLGLAIARELTTLHGGALSVTDAPEGGACFTVAVPLHAPPGAAMRAPSTSFDTEGWLRAIEELRRVPFEPTAPGPPDAELVLVVEDNPEMNRFLCDAFEGSYRVVSAFDGKDGLRKAIELRPDLVLTDVMMPEMSGDALVRAIRDHRELDRTPIVVLTAKADDELRVLLLREGAQDYLTKPFSVAELRSRVDNLIAARRAHEAEARLATLTELAPDGIFVADLDGRYTNVNPAGARMLGYTSEEIVGKTIVDLIPPEDVERLASSKASMSQGAPDVGEWRLRRKDGSYLPVEVSAKILPDGRWQGIVRDISERKRLVQSLEKSHADLNRAQMVAGVGSWLLDFRENVLRWSDEEYRIFGVPMGTPMSYETFVAYVHPDDRSYVDREWTAAIAGGSYDIEHRVIAGGRIKWVREKADLEFDERGQLIGGVGITQDITERKRLEEQRQRAQELVWETQRRFELAVEGAGLASWDWNVKTGEVVFDPRWARMRGFRPEEVAPHVDSWVSGVHPEDMARVQKALQDHMHGLTDEYRAEHRVRTKSGAWIWILDVGRVFERDERGEPARMVGIESDITDRKRLEEELRVSHARAWAILSISADAIITTDQGHRITLFNEGAEKMFGYSRAEAIGAPVEMLLPERFRMAHREHVARFAAGDAGARRMGERAAEIVGRRKTGEEFPADAAIARLEVGGTTILTVAVRDITEQKRAEKEQKFLAEFGVVLASTIDYEETVRMIARLSVGELAEACIVETVEEGGRVQRFTVAHRDPEKQALARTLQNLPLDRSRPYLGSTVFGTKKSLLMRDVTRAYLDSIVQSGEHRRALEELAPTSLMAIPLSARGGVVGSMVFIRSRDPAYSEEDLARAEQVALRAELAVEKARLYRTARDAVRMREEVLGVVAHDLRNPLGTILMQADLLRRDGPEPERRSRRPGDVIERAANRMNRLIQDLLDVSRIEGGGLSIERERVSASGAVSDAVQAQQPLATAASVELRGDVATDLPEVWADRHRLLQVFDNLIGNALKFTKAGGSVTVRAAVRGDEVLFSIADTGRGIAAEDLPHVFERFWQASEGERRRGAGLGLSIVKGIVETHGGRIWVESTLGRGSTFFFTIPAAPRAERFREGTASSERRA